MLGKGPTITDKTDFTPAYIRRLTEIKNTGSLSQQTIDAIDANLANYAPSEKAPEDKIERDVSDTPPPSDGSLPDSPFNYEGLDINDETEFREVLLNDGKGDTFKADIPWGALTNEQQQDIDNIYNNYPYPNQESDRAKATYDYLNTQLGVVETPTEDVEEKVNELPFFEAGEIPTPEEQTIILESYSRKSFQEVIQAPRRAEFDEGSAGETEYQRKLTNYRAVTERWNRQPASQKIAYFKTFTPEQLANGVNAIKDDDRFVIYPFATIITQPNATNSGDPAKNVLRDIYNKNYRKSEIRGGDPKAYDTATTPQLDTKLTDRKLDTIEGADYLMIKPAFNYLDIIQLLKQNSDLPIAAYHVSGECAMLAAACEKGWLDFEKAMPETLLSIKRAGADVILTYFAKDYAKMYKAGKI